MYSDRIKFYEQIEEIRKTKLLVYITSDRANLDTQIGNDILMPFANHLDCIGDVDKITLYLYTRGGNTLTAWSLVNLIRNFCKNFEIIVPFNCHSSGTLICLGANNIVMTKQATLGPIDPSTTGHFNPSIPNTNPPLKIPISVEFVNAYIEMAKKEINISDPNVLANIFLNLSNQIHPLALGQVYKSKTQIQMLAKKLLEYQQILPEKQDEIIRFLCSDSGSHDYTIHRKEAKSLGLNIEKPDENLYQIIKNIYLDIENELELATPYDPRVFLSDINDNGRKDYSFHRALIESIEGGADTFISEGVLIKQTLATQPIPQQIVNDNRTFEGWKHHNKP